MHPRLVHSFLVCATLALGGTASARQAGEIWFPTTVFGSGKLMRVDQDGVQHVYTGINAAAVAPAGGGKVFVADSSLDEIAVVTAAGKVSSFPFVDPQAILRCPDGTLWVRGANVGGALPFTRVDETGTVVVGPIQVGIALASEVVDASGALWLTEIFNAASLTRVDANGTVTTVPLPFASPGFTTPRVEATGDGTLVIANGTTTIHRFDLAFQPLAPVTAPAPITVVSPGRARTLVGYSPVTNSVIALSRSGTVLRSFPVPWFPSPSMSIYNVWEAPDGCFWIDGSPAIFQFAAERFDSHGQSLGKYPGVGAGLAQGDITGRMLLEFAPSSADLDGDGASNRVEVVVGSNPLDMLSVPAALSASASGTPGSGMLTISIHAPTSAGLPFFVALSLNGRGGVKLDPPYASPAVPLGLDPWLTLSMRAPPLRPTLGGVLDANGDAASVTNFGPALSGQRVFVSAIYATRSAVPAATSQVTVQMP